MLSHSVADTNEFQKLIYGYIQIWHLSWVATLKSRYNFIQSDILQYYLLIYYQFLVIGHYFYNWLPVYNTGDWIDISVDVFNETQPGSAQQADFKKELWSYELVQVLVLVLKQNFELIPGKWKVAAELATFAR